MESRPSVLLISVDALKPELVFHGEKYGISLDHIYSMFVKNGASAGQGMKSVFPSFTYACHQSMITGTYPDTHGTLSNAIFDPDGVHKGAWYWFASDAVQNLWELARANGYLSASVAFPTSLGAKGDFIAPEFWFDGSELDSRLLDAVSRPQGLVSEIERAIGRFPGGLDLTPDGDRRRLAGGLWVLENKLAHRTKPFFLSMYFASFDEMAHNHGVYSPEAMAAITEIDRHVGEAVAKAQEVSGNNLVVCLVSDHGIIDNTANIHPNAVFRQHGLIDAEHGKLTGWRAWFQRSGGTGEVRLKDPGDSEAHQKVEELLRSLEQDASSGIAQILTGEEVTSQRHGFPLCDFAIIAKRGYELRDDFDKPYLTRETTQRAQHGYDEEYEEMLAFYGIAGPSISPGIDLGQVNLVDVAPTLAFIMGFPMKDAQGRSLL